LIFVDSFVKKTTLRKTDPTDGPPTESVRGVCFFVELSFIFGQIVENR